MKAEAGIAEDHMENIGAFIERFDVCSQWTRSLPKGKIKCGHPAESFTLGTSVQSWPPRVVPLAEVSQGGRQQHHHSLAQEHLLRAGTWIPDPLLSSHSPTTEQQLGWSLTWESEAFFTEKARKSLAKRKLARRRLLLPPFTRRDLKLNQKF